MLKASLGRDDPDQVRIALDMVHETVAAADQTEGVKA